jgi:hypothetical protein
MQRLVLSTEQSEQFAAFSGTVEVIDCFGRKLGELTAEDMSVTETKTLSDAELDEVRRQVKETAAKGAAFTAQQVRD